MTWKAITILVFVICFLDIMHGCVQVMDLSGGSRRSFAPGLGRVVVSTLCVQDNLIAAGGFNGDLVIKNSSQQEPVCRFAIHCSCLFSQHSTQAAGAALATSA